MFQSFFSTLFYVLVVFIALNIQTLLGMQNPKNDLMESLIAGLLFFGLVQYFWMKLERKTSPLIAFYLAYVISVSVGLMIQWTYFELNLLKPQLVESMGYWVALAFVPRILSEDTSEFDKLKGYLSIFFFVQVSILTAINSGIFELKLASSLSSAFLLVLNIFYLWYFLLKVNISNFRHQNKIDRLKV